MIILQSEGHIHGSGHLLSYVFGHRKSLGWILLAGSAVAFVDSAVCRAQVGKGEWNHWGYAPMLTAIGSVLLGVLDRA
jgi:hypothetical protein